MAETALHFASGSDLSSASYFLLELSPELVKEVESQKNDLGWTIRGRATDDAVLCTSEKTYNLRSVVLSDALCLFTGPRPGEGGDIILRDTMHEILETTPCIAKLHRLNEILRGHEYDEGVGQEDDADDGDSRPTKRMRRTYDDVRSELQASDTEFARGLKDSRVLRLDGRLRPIASAYLHSVLELLLASLASLSLSHESAPVIDLVETLESDHDVRRDVSMQVMSWFGELSDEGQTAIYRTKWKMDVNAVLKQVGLGILREFKDHSISVDELLDKWRTAVGDTFESEVSITLLRGNYLDQTPTTARKRPSLVSYFPASSLPLAPVQRFAEIFLSRSRWSADDIVHFLSDIAIDNKERDRLLMRYARIATEKDGSVWYTARSGVVS